jgi:C-terminal processing protease CtpA/Prc
VTRAQFLLPVIPAPDREQTTYVHNGEWKIAPETPFLAAPKVFLTDAHAIGYAESCLEIVRSLKLGEIVGTPTAGSDGTVNRFTLPGDFTVLFTGAKVVDHEGNPYHGVGIKPTVAVAPTRAGIAAGHDELLDKAVQLLAPASP